MCSTVRVAPKKSSEKVNVNVSLPGDLRKQAEEENLNLSRLLREAVVRELHRRSVMKELVSEEQVYEVAVSRREFLDENDQDLGAYTGLIRGKLVHASPAGLVFLTSDKRVIVYYEEELGTYPPGEYRILQAGATERELVDFLREHIPIDFEFVAACRALGVRPVVEL
jgi:post-segregation antitoxin (ccd killing protein)